MTMIPFMSDWTMVENHKDNLLDMILESIKPLLLNNTDKTDLISQTVCTYTYR